MSFPSLLQVRNRTCAENVEKLSPSHLTWSRTVVNIRVLNLLPAQDVDELSREKWTCEDMQRRSMVLHPVPLRWLRCHPTAHRVPVHPWHLCLQAAWAAIPDRCPRPRPCLHPLCIQIHISVSVALTVQVLWYQNLNSARIIQRLFMKIESLFYNPLKRVKPVWLMTKVPLLHQVLLNWTEDIRQLPSSYIRLSDSLNNLFWYYVIMTKQLLSKVVKNCMNFNPPFNSNCFFF